MTSASEERDLAPASGGQMQGVPWWVGLAWVLDGCLRRYVLYAMYVYVHSIRVASCSFFIPGMLHTLHMQMVGTVL